MWHCLPPLGLCHHKGKVHYQRQSLDFGSFPQEQINLFSIKLPNHSTALQSHKQTDISDLLSPSVPRDFSLEYMSPRHAYFWVYKRNKCLLGPCFCSVCITLSLMCSSFPIIYWILKLVNWFHNCRGSWTAAENIVLTDTAVWPRSLSSLPLYCFFYLGAVQYYLLMWSVKTKLDNRVGKVRTITDISFKSYWAQKNLRKRWTKRRKHHIWCPPAIPVPGTQRQVDQMSKVILRHTGSYRRAPWPP